MIHPTGFFRPDQYIKPTSAKEAVELLSRHGDSAWPVAGGTDLVVEKNPAIHVLVDVTGLGLEFIRFHDNGISIGATTLIADIGNSPMFANSPYRIIAQAATELGTPQIRNMATIGGNICRPSPAADMAPPLLALRARIKTLSRQGEREIPIEDFFKGVNLDALQPGELVTEILVPSLPKRSGTAFIKKGRVVAGDLSIVSVATCIALGGNGACEEVSVALGSVAPTPMRAREAEGMLRGKKPSLEVLQRAAQKASEEIKPITDVRASEEYRRTLSRILVERALEKALEQATQSHPV